ncbi:MAG: hypothetical protein N2C14_21060, partial [Planctomycetales bacterium]
MRFLDRWPPRLALLSSAMLLPLLHSPAIAQDEGKIFTQVPEVQPSNLRPEVEEPKPESKPAEKLNLSGGPAPQWIWGREPARGNEQLYFRKKFTVAKVKAATLAASCDNRLKVWLNGKQVA